MEVIIQKETVMRYKALRKVLPHEINNSRFNEDHVYRELAHSLVKEIPMEDLKRLFVMEKVDPELPYEPTLYKAEILIQNKY